MIERRLMDAYEATDYVVEDPRVAPIRIRHGERCPALDELLDAHGVAEWAFVTACNPRSEPLSAEENARRMRELEATIGRYPAVYHGRGIGTDGWADEPSVLILGIVEAEARRLGARFGQNAIVAGVKGDPARVVALV